MCVSFICFLFVGWLIGFWFAKEKRNARQYCRPAQSGTEKIHAGQKFLLVGDAFDAGDFVQSFHRHAGFRPAAIGAGGQPGYPGGQQHQHGQ